MLILNQGWQFCFQFRAGSFGATSLLTAYVYRKPTAGAEGGGEGGKGEEGQGKKEKTRAAGRHHSPLG